MRTLSPSSNPDSTLRVDRETLRKMFDACPVMTAPSAPSTSHGAGMSNWDSGADSATPAKTRPRIAR